MQSSAAELIDFEPEVEITLEQATERLAAAFDRLETLIATRPRAEAYAPSDAAWEEQQALLIEWQEQYGELEQQFYLLKEENETLLDMLEKREKECREVRAIAHTVSERLDGSIGTIDRMLQAEG